MTEAQASTGTQLAVIFGAGGGIGSELARLLAADGLRVALIDKDASAVDAIAAEIGAAGAGVYPSTSPSTPRCKSWPHVSALNSAPQSVDQQHRMARPVREDHLGVFGRGVAGGA